MTAQPRRIPTHVRPPRSNRRAHLEHQSGFAAALRRAYELRSAPVRAAATRSNAASR